MNCNSPESCTLKWVSSSEPELSRVVRRVGRFRCPTCGTFSRTPELAAVLDYCFHRAGHGGSYLSPIPGVQVNLQDLDIFSVYFAAPLRIVWHAALDRIRLVRALAGSGCVNLLFHPQQRLFSPDWPSARSQRGSTPRLYRVLQWFVEFRKTQK